MTAAHETAYPRLKSQPSAEDLLAAYTPTNEEIEMINTIRTAIVKNIGRLLCLV